MEAKTLALYLGCEFIWNQFPDVKYKMDGIYQSEVEPDKTIVSAQPNRQEFYHDEIKLILRPLSSMTEEEGKEYAGLFFEDYNPELTKFYNFGHCISIRYYDAFLHLPDEYTPKQFLWLLSKGFDLFGLIEKGEAIDSTLKHDKE